MNPSCLRISLPRLVFRSREWTLAPLLAVLGLGGCLAIPLPSFDSTIQSGRKITPAGLDWIRAGETTRAEVQGRLGVPWADYRDLGVMVYYWETCSGYWIKGFIAGDANMRAVEEISRLNYFLVKLDSQGRVVATSFVSSSGARATKDIAASWVEKLWDRGVLRIQPPGLAPAAGTMAGLDRKD